MGHVNLAEIKALSVEERIALVQAIWDTIAVEVGTHVPTPDVLKEVDLRLCDLDNKPDCVVTWERIKSHIRCHT
jgi:putative addiction module component (TIGR02574 family)